MSKHNNNLMPSSKARCKCGRHMTLGEDKAGMTHPYTCPDCQHHQNMGLNWFRQQRNGVISSRVGITQT